MDDHQLIDWLQHGKVIVVGKSRTTAQPSALIDLPGSGQVSAVEAWSALRATYDPCHAPTWRDCLYCPWERCQLELVDQG